jgi:hypothetical protein
MWTRDGWRLGGSEQQPPDWVPMHRVKPNLKLLRLLGSMPRSGHRSNRSSTSNRALPAVRVFGADASASLAGR